jgi:hypothetical protein
MRVFLLLLLILGALAGVSGGVTWLALATVLDAPTMPASVFLQMIIAAELPCLCGFAVAAVAVGAFVIRDAIDHQISALRVIREPLPRSEPDASFDDPRAN